MARKGSQPALYELIRPRGEPRNLGGNPGGTSGGAPGSSSPRSEPFHVAPSAAGTHAAPAPSRVIRVPVGYVYGGVAVLLISIVASYLYGVSVGDRVAKDRREQQRIDEMNAASRMPEIDPLNAGKVPPSLTKEPSTPEKAPGAGSGTSGGTGNRGRTADANLGPAPGGDPRQPDLNYFVVAHAPTRDAQAMVDFCRKNGLDAHLVPDDNGDLRVVIVTPGFKSGERREPAVTKLAQKIRDVGLKWKDAAHGNRDFGDAYPSKYQPRQR